MPAALRFKDAAAGPATKQSDRRVRSCENAAGDLTLAREGEGDARRALVDDRRGDGYSVWVT